MKKTITNNTIYIDKVTTKGKNNMKTIKNILATAAITLAALTACTAEETTDANPADAVTISTIVATTEPNTPISRTDADADTRATYAPGKNATLTLLYNSMTAATGKRAAYTYNGSSWRTGRPLYWNDLNPNGSDRYPFFAASPGVPAGSPAVAADQSTTEAYTASDQLVAYATTASARTNVKLNMRHVLSQITVNLTSGKADGTNPDLSDDLLSAATLTIAGAQTAYSLAYSSNSTSPATATASGQANDITPMKAATGAITTFAAIVPMQTFAIGDLTLTFVIDGNTYTWKNTAEIALATGVNTGINITATKTNVLLGTVELTPWNEVTVEEDNIKLKDITTSGNIALPSSEEGTFYIGTTESESTGGTTTTHTGIYAWNGTALTATTALTWDKLKEEAHNFSATFAPTTALAAGHEKDYLVGKAANVAYGKVIIFTKDNSNALTHANAKLTIELTSSDGSYTDEHLNAATIKATINKVSACDATGKVTIADAPAAKSVTLTAAAATAAAILAPQTLVTNTISITIGKNTYYMPNSIMLTANHHTTVKANIMATEVGLSVDVKEWGTTSQDEGIIGNDDVQIDGALTGIAEAGMLNMYPYISTDAVMGSGTALVGTYPIIIDGTTQKAAFNKTDGRYTPIKWEALTDKEASYTYTALFTPTADPDQDNATLNHERDYLGGVSTAATAWAIKPTIELKHLMAKLVVKLSCEDGTYTATELNDASTKITVQRKNKVDVDNFEITSTGVNINLTGVNGGSVDGATVTLIPAGDATDGATATPATFSAILCPHELTANDDETFLTLTIAPKGGAEKTYELKKAVTLVAGETFTFTAKLTATNMVPGSITVTPWDDSTTGDGNLEMP